MLLCFSA